MLHVHFLLISKKHKQIYRHQWSCTRVKLKYKSIFKYLHSGEDCALLRRAELCQRMDLREADLFSLSSDSQQLQQQLNEEAHWNEGNFFIVHNKAPSQPQLNILPLEHKRWKKMQWLLKFFLARKLIGLKKNEDFGKFVSQRKSVW